MNRSVRCYADISWSAEALDWAEGQYTAFTERRRVEAEVKGAERYVDDLAATAKLLENASRQAKPKPRKPRGKKK